ncbi:unnamed protein product [Protopolystoma xenopodis]|uniref:Uncharacterized protein n=1 Tax=Protopolystoma xenopodis TaxID=117903 RepID=A0A448WMN7_9PLAT|nr:unnamed protein product [Protopolystoma xenopodis]
MNRTPLSKLQTRQGPVNASDDSKRVQNCLSERRFTSCSQAWLISKIHSFYFDVPLYRDSPDTTKSLYHHKQHKHDARDQLKRHQFGVVKLVLVGLARKMVNKDINEEALTKAPLSLELNQDGVDFTIFLQIGRVVMANSSARVVMVTNNFRQWTWYIRRRLVGPFSEPCKS